METAAELHEARVLRARIEVKEAELAAHAALSGDGTSGDLEQGDLEGLTAEIGRLKADYRRLLACQADRDYRRRRADWRAQQGATREGKRTSACA